MKMKTITITQKIMNDIESTVVDNGQRVDFDDELNIETIEYNNQKHWLNDSFYCFEYDATWKGEPDSDDEGFWAYSVQVGDVVELVK